jgi:hypothetical protein
MSGELNEDCKYSDRHRSAGILPAPKCRRDGGITKIRCQPSATFESRAYTALWRVLDGKPYDFYDFQTEFLLAPEMFERPQLAARQPNE